MDDLALLTRIREDVPDRSAATIARERASLVRAIGAPHAAKAARTRGSLVWVGSAALATCGLAGALVVAGLPGTPGSADPAAAAVLSSAASAALAFTDPVVGPGQYLEVRTDALYAAMGTTEADAEVARQARDGSLVASDMTAFLEREVQAVWVPADRSDEWVEVRCARQPAQTFGSRSETFAAEQGVLGNDGRYVLPGGATEAGDAVTMLSDDDAANLPRDPAELLQSIYRDTSNQGPTPDGEALVWIADRLRSGIASAEVRSLFYDTAALIPGVTITEQQATLNGQTGTAIGREEGQNGVRQDIIIDPTTGAFIGERQVLTRSVADMPAGTAIGSTSVTTTVVDAIPEGTTLCAA